MKTDKCKFPNKFISGVNSNQFAGYFRYFWRSVNIMIMFSIYWFLFPDSFQSSLIIFKVRKDYGLVLTKLSGKSHSEREGMKAKSLRLIMKYNNYVP